MADAAEDRELVRKSVETWRRAGPELERIRPARGASPQREGRNPGSHSPNLWYGARTRGFAPEDDFRISRTADVVRRLREAPRAKHPAK